MPTLMSQLLDKHFLANRKKPLKHHEKQINYTLKTPWTGMENYRRQCANTEGKNAE